MHTFLIFNRHSRNTDTTPYTFGEKYLCEASAEEARNNWETQHNIYTTQKPQQGLFINLAVIIDHRSVLQVARDIYLGAGYSPQQL